MSALESKVISTPVQSVIKMNKVLGNNPIAMYDDTWRERIYNQILNIGDEIEELREAIKNEDKTEMADAVADIFTFAYGVDFFLNGFLYTEECESYRKREFSDFRYYASEIALVDDTYSELLSIAEEMKDLEHFTFNNFNFYIRLLREALCDLLDDVGINFVFFDFEELMKEVTRSNLTKVCLSVEERDDTLEHYQQLGVEVYSHDTPEIFEGVEYYVVYSSKDQKDKNGKVYRKGKFLKNVKRFKEPEIDSLIEN